MKTMLVLLLSIPLGLLFGQAAAAAQPDSPFTVTGIIAILGAITVMATAIITAWRTGSRVTEAKVAVAAVAAATTHQDQKLDRIEILVDGRYGEVLQELADVKLLLAHATGREADTSSADSAQLRADNQASRVAAAGQAAGAKEPDTP